jgi:hypothetical protein
MQELLRYLVEGPDEPIPTPLLYYYSPIPLTEVLTIRARWAKGEHAHDMDKLNEIDKESFIVKTLPGSIADCIGFFMDPIPMDVIGGRFSHGHPVWAPGATVYECIVHPDELPYDVPYYLTENAIAGLIELNLDPDANQLIMAIRQYAKRIAMDKMLMRGHGRAKAIALMRHYRGYTRARLEQMIIDSMKPWSKIDLNRYSPDVPRLLVWPNGPLPVSKVNKLIVPTVTTPLEIFAKKRLMRFGNEP